MNKWHVYVPAICVSLLAVGASAAESQADGLDYTLRAGVAYSDNLFRTASPLEEDVTSAAVGVELRGQRPLGRLRYDAAVDIMYYQYLDGFSGGELFGRGLLNGSYDFFPDHFTWNASVNFDQLRGDLFQPISPGNVEDVYTLSTGPTLHGELFGAIDTQVDGHYIRAIYTGSTIDNETVGGRLGLGRRTGPHSRYGLGASVDDVSYLGGPVSSALDFQRGEAFVYGELSGARTELSAELGYTQADGDNFDGDGPMARFRLTRKMSPALTAYLGYRREFPTSQAGLTVSDPTASGGGVFNTSLVTSSPREAWTGEAGFQYNRTRSNGEIGFYHLDEKSLIAALGDHKYDELRARLTRKFTPRTHGSIYAGYSREDFSAFAQTYDEIRVGAEYGHDFTRSVGLDVRIQYQDRNGNNGASSYNELSGGVFLRYSGSLLGRSTATSPGGRLR